MYCQKCRTPVRLDESLDNLNPASFKILLAPQPPQAPKTLAARQRRDHYDSVAKDAGPPQQKRTIPSPNKSSSKLNPAMSFVMLSDSQINTLAAEEPKSAAGSLAPSPRPEGTKNGVDPAEPLSQQMEMNMKLFEILSARSDIDHPICSECTDLLMHGLQQRQATVNRERDAYMGFLKQAQASVPTEEEQRQAKEALATAQAAEAKALEELEALEAEKAKVEDDIAALDRESAELEREEEAFWRERNAFDIQLAKHNDEKNSLQNRLANDSKLLESLQRTNVYNDSFCIGHDGHFGTINGLRLGRLAEHPVDWAEINAAWGQALLLLTVVSEKLGHQFQGYRLQPIGSTSKIEKLEYPQNASQSSQTRNAKPKVTQYDLFTSGDLPLGLGFLHRGFDNAMVCFIDCLKQLGDYVERSSATPGPDGVLDNLALPYRIDKDKVGGASIKLGTFGQEEQWTKACKYTLTCCKYLLAHASHVDDLESRTRR
ncbi:Vacuolar protein sorting-associated protein atg6 [Sphaceloma murrayae]|uniref:Vacuolar protein sorting-associated protein atg6 n=1 Tax=Sphaceloma murrayae TaxID=2082308 RepID=A0A2K1R3G1_9PEZI|nr:Vacuolar protein sorting-associated protein atg6 [Sphaceloma murrayae]